MRKRSRLSSIWWSMGGTGSPSRAASSSMYSPAYPSSGGGSPRRAASTEPRKRSICVPASL